MMDKTDSYTLTKRQDLSQKELAEQLYISDNTTDKWKLDLSFQDRLRLFALSEILNISLYD